MSIRHHRFLAIGLAAALSFTAAACSSSSDADEPAATTAAGKVIAPVIVDVATANGTTVRAGAGNNVVLKANNPVSWKGTVANPSVATFVPGRSDGSATYNPGLTDLHTGSTDVTMTDGSQTVTFKLEVTPAA